MYICSKCGHQTKSGETQFKSIARRELKKGWEIVGEKKICFDCWSEEEKEHEKNRLCNKNVKRITTL